MRLMGVDHGLERCRRGRSVDSRRTWRRRRNCFGLSGYLEKLGADRALEKERHKYAELNLRLQNELEFKLRRLQLELDRVGLLNQLRTSEEVPRLDKLWKHVTRLQDCFIEVADHSGLKKVLASVPENQEAEDMPHGCASLKPSQQLPHFSLKRRCLSRIQ